MSNDLIYDVKGLSRSFPGPSMPLRILSDLNLEVLSGDTLSILGASGSGKSTLLQILGTLDRPCAGRVLFYGQDLLSFSRRELEQVRNQQIGFVFQFHHLLAEFNALENVAMPCIIGGMNKSVAFDKAYESLCKTGLKDRALNRVTTLSGGERQRVSIARAIVRGPDVLLADEPTGNLDTKTSYKINELMLSLNQELKMTLIVVTHDLELAGSMHRRLELRAGELYEITG